MFPVAAFSFTAVLVAKGAISDRVGMVLRSEAISSLEASIGVALVAPLIAILIEASTTAVQVPTLIAVRAVQVPTLIAARAVHVPTPIVARSIRIPVLIAARGVKVPTSIVDRAADPYLRAARRIAANIEAAVRRGLTWALAPAPSVVLGREETSEILLHGDGPVLAEASEVDAALAAER